MLISKLLPALLLAALILVYYMAISWVSRRLWRAGRISGRTFAFVISGRLPFLVILASLLSPLAFGATPAAALMGVAAGAVVWALYWRGSLAALPNFDAMTTDSQTDIFQGMSRAEKAVIWAFMALFAVAAVVVVALLLVLAPGG